jgi:hypothetical protein
MGSSGDPARRSEQPAARRRHPVRSWASAGHRPRRRPQGLRPVRWRLESSSMAWGRCRSPASNAGSLSGCRKPPGRGEHQWPGQLASAGLACRFVCAGPQTHRSAPGLHRQRWPDIHFVRQFSCALVRLSRPEAGGGATGLPTVCRQAVSRERSAHAARRLTVGTTISPRFRAIGQPGDAAIEVCSETRDACVC